MQECDTVIFLDYPLDVCLDGILERCGRPRSDMPWVEPKQYDEEFIESTKNYNLQNRPQVMKLLDAYSYKNILIFKNRNEADDFLSQL